MIDWGKVRAFIGHFLLLVPAVLSFIVVAAHFLRQNEPGLVLVFLFFPLLMFFRRRWVSFLFRLFLTGMALLWVNTAFDIMLMRRITGGSQFRPFVILLAVALVCLLSSLPFYLKKLKAFYCHQTNGPAYSFVLTAILLSVVHNIADNPMIIAERYFRGAGWLEIAVLSLYSAFITAMFLDAKKTGKIRLAIWSLFSVVFFGQLALGLMGMEKMLMTGKLHFPVPALIIGGPIFRCSGLFMIILLGSALVLTGPAWCSYLCYFGAWDNVAAVAKRKVPSSKSHQKTRVVVFFGIVLVALIMHILAVSHVVAVMAGAVLGIAGLVVIVMFSVKSGSMVHCHSYCPVGLVSDFFGKLSPFRIKIGDNCTDCGVCSRGCRYGALGKKNIAERKPAISCSLCGDCVGYCPHNAIYYTFPGLSSDKSRTLFIVLIVSLHALFLGVARI